MVTFLLFAPIEDNMVKLHTARSSLILLLSVLSLIELTSASYDVSNKESTTLQLEDATQYEYEITNEHVERRLGSWGFGWSSFMCKFDRHHEYSSQCWYLPFAVTPVHPFRQLFARLSRPRSFACLPVSSSW